MTSARHSFVIILGTAIGAGISAGCQQGSAPTTGPTSTPAAKSETTATSPQETTNEQPAEPVRPKRSGPVKLGSSDAETAQPATEAETTESVVSALQPLQILLGKWNGTSRNAVADEPEWVWDFRTDPKQPALKLTSDKGEFLRDARLTYLPGKQEYQLTATDRDDQRRVFQGTFSQPVEDVPGDNDKLQRTYKLELTEANPLVAGETWQIVFAQQENDRYIVEVNRQRGSGAFARIDTIHTQREGTSFAVSSTDFGDRTCVISQGLGTIAVNYQGKSYWVCCTGCKAAFEEEPEKWIARYEAKKKAMQPQ